jgi:hypothetical protein
MMRRAQSACAVALLSAAGLLAGCRGDAYQMTPVTGRVTCQGQPVEGGIITFQPLDAPEKTGRPAGQAGVGSSGTVEADGSFTLTSVDPKLGAGALIGPHSVVFRLPPTRRPTITPDERAAMSPEEIKVAEEINSKMPVFPPCPCSADISPGEVEVKRGENDFSFTLSSRT